MGQSSVQDKEGAVDAQVSLAACDLCPEFGSSNLSRYIFWWRVEHLTFQSEGQLPLAALIPGSPGCLLMTVWLPTQISPQREKVFETDCLSDLLANLTSYYKLIKWHFDLHICLVNLVSKIEGPIDWSYLSADKSNFLSFWTWKTLGQPLDCGEITKVNPSLNCQAEGQPAFPLPLNTFRSWTLIFQDECSMSNAHSNDWFHGNKQETGSLPLFWAT